MTSTNPPLTESPIVYPDSDGERMADDTEHFDWIVKIKTNLDSLFRHDPNVFVAGDLLWYPVEGRPDIRRAPDTLVAFGRPKGDRGSYRQWEETHIPPQVVFEILSVTNPHPERADKFAFYEQYGVAEYYLYDLGSKTLDRWQRQAGHLQAIPTLDNRIRPHLNIRFDLSGAELR